MKKIILLLLVFPVAAFAFGWDDYTDPAGQGASWGTESGSHYLYVNGARTDTYVENGSITYPYKTIQAALDWCNADAAIQMSTANGLWARYIVKISAGNYTENLTINNEKYIRLEMDGVRVTGNVNLLTTQGSGDYYSKIEFVGCPSNRAFRGRAGEITGKVYGTRNNDALIYVAFNGINLMGDICAATNGTWVMYFGNCSWNALDANGNQTNTGTPFMYTRDLALILVEGRQTQFKGHIADSADAATATKVEFYDVADCRFDLINITPTNDMRMLNCRFDSDITITAKTLYCDNITYTGIKGRTNTLAGCTIASLEPKLAGAYTDTLKMTSAVPIMFGAVPVKDTLTVRLRIPDMSTDSLWSDNIQPGTANTGQLGTATNAFNSSHIDTTYQGFLGVGISPSFVANEGVAYINSNNVAASMVITSAGAAATPAPGFISRSSRGTIASPTATQSGDYLGLWGGRGYYSSSYSTGSRAFLGFYAAENFTSTAQGTKISMATTPRTTATAQIRFTIWDNGKISFGVSDSSAMIIDSLRIEGKLSGSKAIFDTIKTALAIKKVFGNAAANLRDTILLAGVKTDSTICAPAYIYDAAAATFNALTYYVRPDTVFIIRVADTDPDSFSVSVVKKK